MSRIKMVSCFSDFRKFNKNILQILKPKFFLARKSSLFEKIEHSSSTIVLAWRNG